MLIIYNKTTKKVVSYSMSTVREPVWGDLKKLYEPNVDFGYFTVDNSLFGDVLVKTAVYSVDDSGNTPVLNCGKYKRIVFECQETEIVGQKVKKYKTKQSGNKNIAFVIRFTDEDGRAFAPVGEMTIKCSAGQLEWHKKNLTGKDTEVTLRWRLPKDETVDAKISARIDGEDMREYDQRRAVVEIEP